MNNPNRDHNRNRHTLALVTIILLMIILLMGAYRFFNNFNPNVTTQPVTTTPSNSTTSVVNQPSQNKTSNVLPKTTRAPVSVQPGSGSAQ